MKRGIKYIKTIIICIILLSSFYYIAGVQLNQTEVQIDMTEKEGLIPEPIQGMVVEQKFRINAERIQEFIFQPFSYGRINEGNVDFFLLDEDEQIIMATSARAQDCVDYMPYTMTFGSDVSLKKGELYTLRIVFNAPAGKNPTFYYTQENSLVKNDIVFEGFSINGNPMAGNLCMGITGQIDEWFGPYYWYIAVVAIAIVILYQMYGDYQAQRGKFTVVTLLQAIWKKYRFLIEQLVGRDFKVKYKRSVLGYCWSFLNPLMTMLVQYLVFSTIFRFGIDNFPVYLLSGNIIFGFFTEAVGQGLTSIVGNASLIRKVYIPKYIYPVTKVFSTSINLFISVIPLLLVAILMGEEINLTILLLPYALGCLLLFCLGIVLLLSAINVFFRDVEYLWNIVSLIWMYATPIFYPAEIIPHNLRFIQMLNPLYHIIGFVRTVLMEGVSPRPIDYLYCLIGGIVSISVGAYVFKRTQGKFVLYI